MLRPTMADKDIISIITFFRSGVNAVKPVDTVVGETRCSVIGKLGMCLFGGKPFVYKTGYIAPPTSDTIAAGKYLVNISGCYHCHSHSITAINYMVPEETRGFIAGGFTMRTINRDKIVASNLTSDYTTGIGNYSIGEFVRAVKT